MRTYRGNYKRKGTPNFSIGQACADENAARSAFPLFGLYFGDYIQFAPQCLYFKLNRKSRQTLYVASEKGAGKHILRMKMLRSATNLRSQSRPKRESRRDAPAQGDALLAKNAKNKNKRKRVRMCWNKNSCMGKRHQQAGCRAARNSCSGKRHSSGDAVVPKNLIPKI